MRNKGGAHGQRSSSISKKRVSRERTSTRRMRAEWANEVEADRARFRRTTVLA